eukprot:3426615-Rhodomonas_salina.2
MRAKDSDMRITLSMWRTAIGIPPPASLSLLNSEYSFVTLSCTPASHVSTPASQLPRRTTEVASSWCRAALQVAAYCNLQGLKQARARRTRRRRQTWSMLLMRGWTCFLA